MNRSWFLFFGGLSILVSILGPTIPIEPEWHKFMDKLPIAITSFLTFMGNQAYDRNPDGSRSTGTGDGAKTAPAAVPMVPLVAVPAVPVKEDKVSEPLIQKP